MPLIDVIFLLLTFFIYAMVLMVRAELVPMNLGEYASADAADPAPVVAISIDQDGSVYIDRQPIAIEEILPRVRAAIEADSRTEVWIGAEQEGDLDRLPIFLEIWDVLAKEGLKVGLVSQKESGR